jgi:hypothetical protein
MDEEQAPDGARSEAVSLLHPWESSGHELTVPIDAEQHFRSSSIAVVRPEARRRIFQGIGGEVAIALAGD